MSNISTEQNKVRIEINEDSSPIQYSPREKIKSNSFPSNSNIKQDIPNNLLDTKNINIFSQELHSIAKTGKTLYTWDELKPYILFFYEKNVKIFQNNKNVINLSDKKSNGDIMINSVEKKDSNIKGLYLNINNENNNEIEKNMNINLEGDFNFHDDNNDNMMNMNIQEQNINYIKPDKNENEYENITNDIIEYINKIRIMPFTIQRIAELLLEPEKYYTSLLKYNRAFNKLVNIDFY